MSPPPPLQHIHENPATLRLSKCVAKQRVTFFFSPPNVFFYQPKNEIKGCSVNIISGLRKAANSDSHQRFCPDCKTSKNNVPDASETHTRVMWATGALPDQGRVELLLWLLGHWGGSRFLIRADRGVRSRKHTGTHQTGSQPPLLSAGASGPGSGCQASDPSAFCSPLPGRHPALRSG